MCSIRKGKGPCRRSLPPATRCPLAPPTHKTGVQIIVDALLAHGVDTVFGYIDASVLPLFDRLYDSPIRFIVPCHEQGGCHMADAYARPLRARLAWSSRPAVPAPATSSPGWQPP